MENKEEIVNNLLCMACLCVGRFIHEVRDEKLRQYYLDALKELPLYKTNTIVPIICWECDAMLRNALSFREQVKDSYRILWTYTENLQECSLTGVSRTPRLSVHINEPVTITPDSDDVERKSENAEERGIAEKGDVTDKAPVENIQTVLCDVKRTRRKKKYTVKTDTKSRQEKLVEVEIKPVPESEKWKDLREIKTESDDDADNILSDDASQSMDTDIDIGDIDTKIQSFLDDIKKNNVKTTESKSRRKKIKEKSTKSKNILTVELSYDEMQAERSRHARRESYQKAQHKCTTCLAVFNCTASLQTHHVKKHKASGEFICSICQTVVTSVDAFTAHYRRHMRRYECAICHKRARDVKSIQQHLHTAHEISLRKYKCKVCGKTSQSLDKHRYHCERHKARVPCPQCDKTFSHRAGLMNHRLAFHERHDQFPCTLCDKVFRWKTSLKRHLEKHASEKKTANPSNKAYCESCDIGFSSVCSLQRHLRNSLKHVTYDQLKYICDHCAHRFVDKTKLRDHIEEKHLFRTFQCHICNKPSKNRVGLEQHVRTVHKGRPNNRMCHHCGKGFPTKVQLESHIRTHTGERPFMCEYCPSTFSQQSNLYKHHRQVHLNMKSKRYTLCKKTKVDGNQTGDPPPTFPLPLMQYIPEGFSF